MTRASHRRVRRFRSRLVVVSVIAALVAGVCALLLVHQSGSSTSRPAAGARSALPVPTPAPGPGAETGRGQTGRSVRLTPKQLRAQARVLPAGTRLSGSGALVGPGFRTSSGRRIAGLAAIQQPTSTKPKRVCGVFQTPKGMLPKFHGQGHRVCGYTGVASSETPTSAPLFRLASGKRPVPAPPAPKTHATGSPSAPSSSASGSPSPSGSATPHPGSGSNQPSSPSASASGSGSASASPSVSPSAPASGSATPSSGRTQHAAGSRLVAYDKPLSATTASGQQVASTFLSPNWTQTALTSTPGALAFASTVFDPAVTIAGAKAGTGTVVLFGGTTTYGYSTAQNATWVWNPSGGAWTQAQPATKPPARYDAEMGYDPNLQEVVMYGGTSMTNTQLTDLWAWNGSNWTQLSQNGSLPPARNGAAFSWDPGRNGFVMFGGANNSTSTSFVANDTWLLTDSGSVGTATSGSWTKMSITGGSPDDRAYTSMAYTSTTAGGQMLMFGGLICPQNACNGSTGNNQTWTLTGSGTTGTWTQVSCTQSGSTCTPVNSPAQQFFTQEVFDPGLGGVVLYGGTDGGTSYNATWAWNGSAWLKANGISSPTNTRYGETIAATNDDVNSVVIFGGETINPSSHTFLSDTWTYSTGVPVMQVSVSGNSAGTASAPIFYTGDQVTVTITAANTGIEPITGLSLNSALGPNSLLAPGAQFGWQGISLTGSSTTNCGPSVTPSPQSSSVVGLIPTFNGATIPTGCAVLATYTATVTGSTQGCSQVSIPAAALNDAAYGPAKPAPIVICGGGLGHEDWWSFDSTSLGNGATADVNAGNGNLVVSAKDSTPESDHGDLGFTIGRAYNSQDNQSPISVSGVSALNTYGTPVGPLGAGWQFDIGSTGDDLSAATSLGSLIVPAGNPAANGGSGSAPLQLNPLAVTYVDRDGTRHVFSLRSASISTAAGVVTLGLGNLLDPSALLDTSTLPAAFTAATNGGTLVCADAAYNAPPGLDESLFRFVQVSGTSGSKSVCAGSSETSAGITVGWSLVRPDRLRYDFNAFGQLIDVVDGSGNMLVYHYAVPSNAAIPSQLLSIDATACSYAATASSSGGASGPTCPHYTLAYSTLSIPSAANSTVKLAFSRVDVTDPAGRVTTYIVSQPAAGSGLLPELRQVWNPDNPYPATPVDPDSTASSRPIPSAAYTYSTPATLSSAAVPCPGSANGAVSGGMMCSASDALGNTTVFTYTPAPIGPDRVQSVTDRRVTGGDAAGGEVFYSYTNNSGSMLPSSMTADSGAPGLFGVSTGLPTATTKAPTDCTASTACERTVYAGIDGSGRVAVRDDGDTANHLTHEMGYFWDGTAAAPACRQPDGVVDNDLCETISRATPTGAPFVLDSGAAGDHITRYTYDEQGDVIVKQSRVDATQGWTDANTQTTTYGMRAQYIETKPAGTAPVTVFNDSVAGSGTVTSTDLTNSSYQAAVLASHPVGYYKLDELSGSIAHDFSTGAASDSSSQNLTYGGGVPLGLPGRIPAEYAAGDPGPTWIATTGSFAGFASGTGASSAFTVESWQKSTDTGTSYIACSPCGMSGLVVGRYNGAPWVQITSPTSGQIGVLATAPVTDGNWHQVAYSYNGSGSASGVTIYVDGAPVATKTYADNLAATAFDTAGAPLEIGNQLSGVPGDGTSLEDVSLYQAALPSTTIAAHYAAITGLSRTDANTLYFVDDQTQQLTPRGNQTANAKHWGDYVTTYRRDLPAPNLTPYPFPGAKLTGPVCTGSSTSSNSTSSSTTNTGLPCETDTPASAGVSAGDCQTPRIDQYNSPPPTSASYAHTCTTYTYDTQGQEITKVTPDAHANGSDTAIKYTYYADTGSCPLTGPTDCDLSGSVSAGGWLKAVTDQAGNSVLFAYDRAGNTARTWERNATQGFSVSKAAWSQAASPPSSAYTESDMSNPVTSNSLSVGVYDTEVVRGDGTVYGSGSNSENELGTSTSNGGGTASSTPVRAAGAIGTPTGVVQIAQSGAGGFSSTYLTVARTNTGKVYQWGVNTPVTQVAVPAPIISIAVGADHVLMLDNTGTVWAYGYNADGQVGNGTTTDVPLTAPIKVHDVHGNALTGVSSIAAGGYHSLAVKTDGTVWAWGNNVDGDLGNGATTNQSSAIQVPGLTGVLEVAGGEDASYAVKADGTVYAWGGNTAGALGTGSTAATSTTPQQITALGAGSTPGLVRQIIGSVWGAAALMSNGNVYAWGYNNAGQLGGATTAGSSSTPVQVPGVTGQVALAGGWATYLSANAAGQTTIWGSTGAGQRGDGTSPSTTAPSQQPTTMPPPYNVSPFLYPWRYMRGKQDAVGNLSTMVTDPDGDTLISTPARGTAVVTSAFDSTMTYDADNETLSMLKPAERAGDQAATTSYDAFGNPTVTVDPNGNATVTAFDSANRKIMVQTTRSSTTNSNGSGCDTNDTNNLKIASTASGAPWSHTQQGNVICTAVMTYDGNDQMISSTDPLGWATTTAYDGLGRKISTTVPRSSSVSEITRWNYDIDGNTLDMCPPRENAATGACTSTSSSLFSTHTSYDTTGRPTMVVRYRALASGPPMALTTATTYDADGNAVSVTDPRGNTTTTSYNVLDRKTSQSVPRSAGVSETTSWNYDPSGNVTSVLAPGSLNTGSGAGGPLVVDGSSYPKSSPYVIPDNASYSSVMLQNGGWITGASTNGLVFTSTGPVSICPTCGVSEAGKGYTGGAGASNGLGNTAGTSAANPGPTGNGGTGGSGSLLAAGGGGGGGGHQSAGSPGVAASGTTGQGGAASGQTDFSDVGTNYLLGSGGGGGGGGQGLNSSPSGAGGNGGGFVHITAPTITVTGVIDASGAPGAASTSNAGGGGGAGGGIWLSASNVTLASASSLTVAGGAGGTGTSAGGAGSSGDVRIDSDSVNGTTPTGSTSFPVSDITAYSYDADNRPVDTVTGAQTTQANPTKDDTSDAVPDAHGLYNMRTRTMYDPDGHVAAVLPPQAFAAGSTAALLAPNTDTAARTDYDLDGRKIDLYDPRYNASVPDTGAGNDGGKGVNQQTSQCPLGADPTAINGLAGYGSGVGVCQTRTSYDADDNVTLAYFPTSTGHDNRYTCTIYSDDNLALEVTSPDPSKTDTTGIQQPVCPTSTTGAIGTNRVPATTTFYDGDGRPILTTDANSVSTTTSYTADGLKAQVTTSPSGSVTHTTTMTYDADGNQVTMTDPRSANPGGYAAADFTTTTSWTTDGLKSQIQAPGLGDNDFDITQYTYDADGNPITTLSPSAVKMDADNYTLDSGGNKQQGLPTVDTFTLDNLLASSSVPVVAHPSSNIAYRSTIYSYTPAGLKSSVDIGQCTVTDPTQCTPTPANIKNGVWADGGITRYTYAPDGLNIAQIGKQNATITTSYDQAGRPVSITDADTKTNTAGQLPKSGSAGDTVTASYYLDGLLRTTADQAPSGAVYADASTYAYNGAGQLTYRTDKSGTAGITAGVPKATSYAYDDAGLPTAMMSDVHSGDSTTMAYDAGGRLIQTSDSGGGLGQVDLNYYNADNTLQCAIVLPAGTQAGQNCTQQNAQPISEDTYTYDNAGNMTGQAATGSAQTFTNTYQYNPAQNVTSYAHTTGGSGSPVTTPYTWDHDGNRLTSTPTGGLSTSAQASSWTYRADNSIATQISGQTNTSTFSENSAGQITQDACSKYTYDDFDRTLSSTPFSSTANGCTTATGTSPMTAYAYDGLDRQRTTTVSGYTIAGENKTTSSSYDGLSSTLVGQVNATSGADATSTSSTGPTVLYQLNPDGSQTALLQTPAGGGTGVASLIDNDGFDNTNLLINTTNSSTSPVGCAANYDPFGNPIGASTTGNGICASGSDTSSTGNAIWYRGDKRDATTGSYQLGNRSYNPNTATFTTPDNHRVAAPTADLAVGTDPLTDNTYDYVNGNPLNFDDPDGHEEVAPGGGGSSPQYDDLLIAGLDAPPESSAVQAQVKSSQIKQSALISKFYSVAYQSGLSGTVIFPALNRSYPFCIEGHQAGFTDFGGDSGIGVINTSAGCFRVPAGKALEVNTAGLAAANSDASALQEGLLVNPKVHDDTYKYLSPADAVNPYAKLQLLSNGQINSHNFKLLVSGLIASQDDVGLPDADSSGASAHLDIARAESEDVAFQKSLNTPGLSVTDKIGIALAATTLVASGGALAIPDEVAADSLAPSILNAISLGSGAAGTVLDTYGCVSKPTATGCGGAALDTLSLGAGYSSLVARAAASASPTTLALEDAATLDRVSFGEAFASTLTINSQQLSIQAQIRAGDG